MKKQNFSPHSCPKFFLKKPNKEIEDNSIIESICVYDGHIISETDKEKKILELELSYNSCYYSSDTPSIKATITTYKKGLKNNPNYEKELAIYKSKKENYEKKLKEWKILKKEYDENEKKKLEEHEKNLLKKLKQKYES